jgi:HlyD family secretion protein
VQAAGSAAQYRRVSRSRPRLEPLGLVLLAIVACGGDGASRRLLGTVERTLIEIVAPVSETIVALPVQRGQRVAAGAVLARLDSTLAEADVARAEAALMAARTGEATADHELVRLQGLRRSSVASQQALEQAELAHDESEARLREARATLAAAQKNLADRTLTAPSDGIVDQLPFDVGERVPVGGVVAVVLDDAAPWVRIWVPEEIASRVEPGQPATIRIDGVDGPLAGRVLDVAHEPEFTPHYALTERERVYLVYRARVLIEKAPVGLRPGLPAEVDLSTGAPEA